VQAPVVQPMPVLSGTKVYQFVFSRRFLVISLSECMKIGMLRLNHHAIAHISVTFCMCRRTGMSRLAFCAFTFPEYSFVSCCESSRFRRVLLNRLFFTCMAMRQEIDKFTMLHGPLRNEMTADQENPSAFLQNVEQACIQRSLYWQRLHFYTRMFCRELYVSTLPSNQSFEYCGSTWMWLTLEQYVAFSPDAPRIVSIVFDALRLTTSELMPCRHQRG
jgi:hypothetical protein